MRSSLVAIGAGLNLAEIRDGLVGDGWLTATLSPDELDADDNPARLAVVARVSVWKGTAGCFERSDIRQLCTKKNKLPRTH